MNFFPKFSIIIPFYNAGQYLEDCITSIYTQNYTNYEIILVDDGSKDNSLAIAHKLIAGHNNVTVIHQENRGVSAARNVGIHKANGKWLIFIDADDYVKNGYLECFDELSKECNVDLLSQGYYSDNYPGVGKKNIYLNDKIIEKKDIFSFVLELSKVDLLGYLWCKSFKKETIDKYNLYFNETYRLMEDSEFILRFLKYTDKIINSHKCLYHYKYSVIGKNLSNHNMFELNYSRYLSLCKIKNEDEDIFDIMNLLLDGFLMLFIEFFFSYSKYQKIKYSRFIEQYLFDYFSLSKKKCLKLKLFLSFCKVKSWKIIWISGFTVSIIGQLYSNCKRFFYKTKK